MKTNWKRCLAALLSFVLLVSCVPAVNAGAEVAEEVVYDFNYQGLLKETSNKMGVTLTAGGGDLYAFNSSSNGWVLRQQMLTAMDSFYGQTSYGGVDNGSVILNWKYAAMNLRVDSTDSGTNLATKLVFRDRENLKGVLSYVRAGDWYAFYIQTPTTGTYDVTLSRNLTKYGVDDASVHILSIDPNEPDVQAAIEKALASSAGYDVSYYKIGSGYSSSDPSTSGVDAETVKLGEWQADGKREHVLVFKADAAQATQSKLCNTMYPSKLTMTRTDDPTPGEVMDKLTPISATVAKEDIVFTAQAEFTYVCEVDGSDYLFILMNDYKMLVYNLDTGALVDSVSGKNLFMQPRSAVMDDYGCLWVSGLGAKLFRYNVRTGESEAITFTINKPNSFEGITNLNVFSLTKGDDGNLYFGTSTRGYFGMCDPVTKTVSCISPWLDGDPNDTRGAGDGDPDSHYSGYGGLVVKGGYIYACLEGDQNGDGLTTHFFVKYNIATKTIVDSVDVTDYINENAGQYRQVSAFGGKYVMLGCNGSLSQTVLIDISGSKMALTDLPGMDVGCYGFVAESDGYAYVTGRSNSGVGMYKINIANLTAEALPLKPFYAGMNAMLCRGSGWATINGEKVIVTYRNNTTNNTVEPVYYDVILENSSDAYELRIERDFTVDSNGVLQGTGNQLRSLAVSADREYLYTGCYGVSKVAQYEVATGNTKIYSTFDEQTDSLLVYNGYLYAGNYSKCTITQVDLKTNERTTFFMLKESIFKQYRAHTLAAGDGKVFLGTVPKTGVKGGVLAWHDIEMGRTYVATGDGADNVYYADNTVNNESAKYYQWHRLSTNELVEDVTIGGLIPNQTINNMIYKDGLIYGTTSIHGGSGSEPDTENAKLFVYDVANSKVIVECDLSTVLSGFTQQIQWIDVIAEDPLQPGKFWGVVSDTLFSFTFDGKAFTITEELSLEKDYYTGTGNVWDHRNIIFDGTYMYVTFSKTGIYMVDRTDTSKYWKLSNVVPKQMEMGADGNLYFFNLEALLSSDLQMIRVGQYTQPFVAESVQAKLDALPNFITDANRAEFEKVQAVYDSLLPQTQKMVNTQKLEEPVYKVDDMLFWDLDAAIAAAAEAEDKTVTLLGDAEVKDVILSGGVILDLNGCALTAEALVADFEGIADGTVIDSSIGNGGLLAVRREAVVLHANNPDLPVYDAAFGGYRFFDYKLELHKSTTNMGKGKEKFWFKFHFYTDDTCAQIDQDAYDLVAADGSNMLVSTSISWQGNLLTNIKFGAAAENGELSTDLFVQSWAEFATKDTWFFLTITGIDKQEAGVLDVTPTIRVNGVEVSEGAIRFVKEDIKWDYGWSDGIV